MDILDVIAIEVPCQACGRPYEITLKQIALSQRMMHDGCPVRAETECPQLFYSGLVDRDLAQDIQQVWARLEKEAHGVGGKVVLHP